MGRPEVMNPNEGKPFTVWITKYALTTGIFSAEVQDCFDTNDTLVRDTTKQYANYYHDREWHRTREEAVRHAEKMRKKKIASLKKSIEKIKKLDFTNGD